MSHFKLISKFEPKGDQPQAIDQLLDGLEKGRKHQTLLGVTGSGKTFTIANVIERICRPTLVIAPNKTLAAQLYGEFKELFPENAVEYFISYYDYYQPEAYLPATDTFIEKDSAINDAIDKMRHSATRSVLGRSDVIVVASVSCIYGLGSPEAYKQMIADIKVGQRVERNDFLSKLVDIQYERDDIDFHRGTFRVRGDTVEIFPAYEGDSAIRVEFFGDEVEAIKEIDPIRGKPIGDIAQADIFPASHFVTPEATIKSAIETIRAELEKRLTELNNLGKGLEAKRLKARTEYDIEMMEEIGFCKGIENYSRHLDGRAPGEPPATLIDYFPKDFLLVIDESHVALPQLHGMYKGDRSRKLTLAEHGFRLPSALDNRPLKFDEFKIRISQVVYVSATPSDYEVKMSEGVLVEQVIRPTGLIDPELEVRNASNQVDDLLDQIRERAAKSERVLVTTLTKRTAEDLTDYYRQVGVRVRYLHSDIDTIERVEILRSLRMGEFDVLIGINLLREGLDLPEVSLVAILDADKEGFLRSGTSLVQTIGRAARHINGKVILYGDNVTRSMNYAITETNRRRKIQKDFNKRNGITPESIKKDIVNILSSVYEADYCTPAVAADSGAIYDGKTYKDAGDIEKEIKNLKGQMKKAAQDLEFEKAAELRDKVRELEQLELFFMKELEEKIKTFPTKPGVYQMKDRDGKVIYIGKAVNLRSRIRSYFGKAKEERYQVGFLMRRVTDVECIITDTEKEALILENTLIKTHQPRYNINLRDDKTYVSLRLNIQHKWPRLTVTRRVKDDGAMYFGPYSSASDVRDMVRFIKKTFRLRTCTDSFMRNRSRPCIEYQIKQCVAPCVDYVDEKAYQGIVKQLIFFLKGKNDELIKDLEGQMYHASEQMKYEEAAELRDKIDRIKSTLEKQKVVSHRFEDRDVIGLFVTERAIIITVFIVRKGILKETRNFSFKDLGAQTEEALESFILQYYNIPSKVPPEVLIPIAFGKRLSLIRDVLETTRQARVRLQKPSRGEKADLLAMASRNAEERYIQKFSSDAKRDRALMELAKKIHLREIPSRIECYDISNIGGKSAVGSMVVFEDGKPMKGEYRKFNIKGIDTSDDYGMLREVLERRFKKSGWGLPDLLMVDGGIGQLNVALTVFEELGVKDIPAVAIAKERDKKPDRLFLPGRKNPVVFGSGSAALHLLQHLRDESHRFGITHHRKRRSKAMIRSELDDIPGIGPATRQKLLKHFGSVEKLKKASLEEIEAVKGVSKKQAKVVYYSIVKVMSKRQETSNKNKG